MMTVEELIDKAAIGFDGKKFYTVSFKRNTYLMDIVDRHIYILTSERIDKRSENLRNHYLTEVKIEELDSVIEHKMYVTYKGNEYEVGRISPRLKDLELFARPGHEEEDTKFGFKTDSMFDTVCHRRILLEEAESIRIESKDVYLELLEKYGGR